MKKKNILFHRVSTNITKQLASIQEELNGRSNANAELRDMLVWVEEMKDNADRSLDIAPTPLHAIDKLEILRQVQNNCLL